MSPWKLLTVRGRMLLVLGVLVSLAGWLLTQRDLLWLGLALVGLCLAAVVITAFVRPRCHVTRWVTPPVAAIGEQIVGEIDLDRAGRDLGAGVMLFEDGVPPTLGVRPRFTVHHREGHGHREFTYLMCGRQRGWHHVGPLLVDIRDPLGLARALRAHDESTPVLVTPVIHRLSPMRGVGGGDLGEEDPQRLGVQGADDVLVREYRPGDDTRRIHWKSSARLGELMVRREEQAWDPTALVLVDTRRCVNVGSGPEASVELLISAGLSIALHLLANGYNVELIDALGHSATSEGAVNFTAARRVLTEHAAEMPIADVAGLHALVEAARASRNGQMVVAVLASPTMDDVELVATTRGAHSGGAAIVLDASTCLTGEPSAREACQDAAAWLTVNGWRATVATAHEPVSAWWLALAASKERT